MVPEPTPEPPSPVPPTPAPALPRPQATVAPEPRTQALASATIVARPGLAFDRQVVAVSWAPMVSVSVVNQDVPITHNFAIYRDAAATSPLPGAQGRLCAGPCSYVLSFPAPQPGTYFFRCDVHPVEMGGQFMVR